MCIKEKSNMTTYKTIVGVCLALIIGGIPATMLIVNTQVPLSQEQTKTLGQNQPKAISNKQHQPTATTPNILSASTTPRAPDFTASAYYYTARYGEYSEFYYPEQCTRFTYRIPPMFRKTFSSLDALLATYPNKELDPDCLI